MRVTTVEQLEKQMAAAEADLALLEAEPTAPEDWNRVYPVDIVLPLYGSGMAQGSFTVESDTVFFAKGVEGFFSVTGVLVSDGSPATLTLPNTIRPKIFDFTFGVRDSGTGGDWSNIPLPSQCLSGGNLHGFRFGRGQRRLPGGSLVTVTVNPTYFNNSAAALGLSSINSMSLQVIVSGIAERRGAA